MRRSWPTSISGHRRATACGGSPPSTSRRRSRRLFADALPAGDRRLGAGLGPLRPAARPVALGGGALLVLLLARVRPTRRPTPPSRPPPSETLRTRRWRAEVAPVARRGAAGGDRRQPRAASGRAARPSTTPRSDPTSRTRSPTSSPPRPSTSTTWPSTWSSACCWSSRRPTASTRPRSCPCSPVRHRPPSRRPSASIGSRPRSARRASTTRDHSRTSTRRHPRRRRRSTSTSRTTAGARSAGTRSSNRPWASGPSSYWPPSATRSTGTPPAPRRRTPNPVRAQLPEAERATFDELLGDARDAYRLRDDDVGLTYIWPMGLLRRAVLEAGRRLAARGALREADDLFEAESREIDALLAGGDTPLSRGAGRADRPATGRGDAAAAVPARRARARPGRGRAAAPHRRPPVRRPRPVLGRGGTTGARTAARGRHRSRGRARAGPVCSRPQGDLGHLEPGDVLVAVATTTSLNAAFPLVAGGRDGRRWGVQPRRDPVPRVRHPRRGRRRGAARRGARWRSRRGRPRGGRGAGDRPRRSCLTGVASAHGFRAAALARHQPPRADHHRHGRDRPLLPRGPRRPTRRDDRHPAASGTTSSSSVPSRPSPSSSTRASSSTAVREAGRHPRPEGDPVRPPLVQPARRGGARVAAPPAEGARLRGHRRRRPPGDALDLLHRPQRHRARGVVVGDRRDRSRHRLRRQRTSSPMPTRCPRSASS